jgi:hypothetical protein
MRHEQPAVSVSNASVDDSRWPVATCAAPRALAALGRAVPFVQRTDAPPSPPPDPLFCRLVI